LRWPGGVVLLVVVDAVELVELTCVVVELVELTCVVVDVLEDSSWDASCGVVDVVWDAVVETELVVELVLVVLALDALTSGTWAPTTSADQTTPPTIKTVSSHHRKSAPGRGTLRLRKRPTYVPRPRRV
jgi:hypothetical protein